VDSQLQKQSLPEKNLAPRILITRLSHIGDCILTLPLLTAIRKQHPNAFIAWAVEPPTHKLLNQHPDLNNIILIPKGWLGKPSCWPSLRKELREHQFDISIDPQGITKSAGLGWISGAKKRIGVRGQWGRELSPWLNNRLVTTKSTHLVDRTMELLAELGFESKPQPNIEFGLPLCRSSAETLDQKLDQSILGDRFVVINPGGSWQSKRWEMDRFGSVASYLKRHHGINCLIVWAGDEEQKMAQTIFDFDPTASVIAPPTSLQELAVVCKRSSFFIGSDTGPMHLATAMGTPCIGLYGTTRPQDSGAYGPQHIAIQKWYQSGSCRKRRNADNDAMRDILAADVFSACDQMIQRLGLKSSVAA